MATPDTLYETLSGPNIVDGITNAKSAWFFFWLGILLLLSGPILNDRFHINLNIIDLFLCLFLMYTILNSLVHNLVFFSRKNIEGVGLLIFYFLVKILFSGKDLSERWYEFSVLFLTFIHVVVAILQWFELIPSFNSYFKIMGFFHNPGPFAIYLATLFVFCLTVFLYSNNSAIKITALVLFLLCIPILVVTISRAAWLGALVGMSFVIETKYRVWATHIKSLRAVTKNLFSIVVIAGVLLVSYQLYLLKENSANGRLLIWKITGVVVKDHCLVGVGLGNFPASFLEYQSLYFQQHPDRVSEEGQLAGETWYAFNDILQITAEQGIIGFGLIGALLFSIVKASIGLLKKI